MGLHPEQRRQRAKLAAHARWAKEDPTPTALRGQAGLRARFEREVRAEHPDLPEHEIARRVEHAYKAHFARMAFNSAKARRKDTGPGDAA